MANRRMFSLDVVNTDRFTDMPISAQCLYFHLGMHADDDGFISNPRQITRLINCSVDDMKVLISKEYVIPFENGIVVIRHWKQNNNVRRDRYKETVFLEEKRQLAEKNGIYSRFSSGIPSDIPSVYPDKVSIGKDSIDKNSINTISSELEAHEPECSGILLPLIDKTDYDVPLSKIEGWEKAYPAVDIKQELHKMAAWLESNPQRKKTGRGIDRFINTWLSKEQDRGGIYRNAQRQQAPKAGDYKLQPEYQEMYDKHLGNMQTSPDAPFQ